MSQSPQVKAVFLDAAHTILRLARPYPEMFKAALDKHGLPRPYQSIESSLRKCWEVSEDNFSGANGDYRMNDDIDRALWHDFYRLMLRDLGIESFPVELLDEIYHQFSIPSNWELFPETLETIQGLHERGIIVGLGSNWDSGLPRILKHLGVLEQLDCVIISAIIGFRKPSREFFLAEAQAAGVEPAEVIHVGDHPVADVKGAIDTGLRAALVWRTSHPAPESYGAPVIPSLLGILDHL
ncbi:MAG: HAD family hydrolase [Planctomycetota bacterium]